MIYKERYQQLLDKMNQYNSGEKGITRVAYTNEEQACLHAFIRLCKDENLQIHIDHCGNLIARRRQCARIAACCHGIPFRYCLSRR